MSSEQTIVYRHGDQQIALVCWRCHGALENDTRSCQACGAVFTTVENVPVFLSTELQEAFLQEVAKDRENGLKNFFKSYPRLYQFIKHLVVPILYTGLTPKQFFRAFPIEALLLNIGSGPSFVHPRVLNVDLFPFSNVHIVASAEALPFPDETFDAICTEQVLEHVLHPQKVALELIRVLKKGGKIYSSVPFMYPLHPSPSDYTRWSVDGLVSLFPGMRTAETGIFIGPICGMLSVLAAGLAVMLSFGIGILRTLLTGLFMLILSPLRFLDLIYARLPGAEYCALSTYVVMQKD